MLQEIHQVTMEVRFTVRAGTGANLEQIVNDAKLSLESKEAVIIPDHFSKRKITSSKMVMSDYYAG